ncbi:MAG: acyl dehydratase [Betaproteobacteria bacterium]|nr:MAG: acyl dehydratase [Betaproteobacteria bacterium]
MIVREPLEFRRVPSALVFMARAILTPRRPGWQAQPPPLAARWRGHRVGGAQLDDFFGLTGLRGHATWPLLYPHLVAFRLQMAVLTDPGFPLPIWTALQVRNHVVLQRSFDRGAVLDFATRIPAQRVVDKGAEIDLHTTAHAEGDLVWESTNTFFYRGRFGAPGDASPLALAPRVEGAEQARWTMPAGGGIRCGRLTGDYNGIHLSDWYARRFGFRGAFQHPQRVIGECLARLPERDHPEPLRLDTWLKGPVYYGAEVGLRVSEASAAVTFALHVDEDARPAIVARLYG